MLAALAVPAAIVGTSLALGTAANAAQPGEWGHSGVSYLITAGQTQPTYPSAACLSADGCTADSTLTLYNQSYNGATISPEGVSHDLIISGTSTVVGSCTSTSTTRIECTIDGSHTLSRGQWLVTAGSWSVTAPANPPAGTLMLEAGWSDTSGNTDQSPDLVVTAPVGDWSVADTANTVDAPGTSGTDSLGYTCTSAGGCSYTPELTLYSHATNGGSFTPATLTVSASGVGQIGTCQVTVNDIACTITERGNLPQGATISTSAFGYAIADSAAPESTVFTSGLTEQSVWQGNNPSNDTHLTVTPPVAGAPMANWQVAGGIGAGLLLVGGAGLAMRRRQRRTAPEAA